MAKVWLIATKSTPGDMTIFIEFTPQEQIDLQNFYCVRHFTYTWNNTFLVNGNGREKERKREKRRAETVHNMCICRVSTIWHCHPAYRSQHINQIIEQETKWMKCRLLFSFWGSTSVVVLLIVIVAFRFPFSLSHSLFLTSSSLIWTALYKYKSRVLVFLNLWLTLLEFDSLFRLFRFCHL